MMDATLGIIHLSLGLLDATFCPKSTVAASARSLEPQLPDNPHE
jgi:hypothetical protein